MKLRKCIKTPVGHLTLVTDTNFLIEVRWEKSSFNESHPILLMAESQLKEYFLGERNCFDVPLSANGTLFQQRVWNALKTIPIGHTTTYGELANQLGNPKASRAVGLANSRNPLPIFIPCHRVIGKNGNLTGFLGGLEAKEMLLNHEQILPKVLDPNYFHPNQENRLHHYIA